MLVLNVIAFRLAQLTNRNCHQSKKYCAREYEWKIWIKISTGKLKGLVAVRLVNFITIMAGERKIGTSMDYRSEEFRSALCNT